MTANRISILLFCMRAAILLPGIMLASVHAFAAPTVSISANPASVVSGSPATLTWSSSGATVCAASSAWSGRRSTANTFTLSPTATSTYTITCSGAGGSTSQSAIITVATTPPTGAIASVQLINTSASAQTSAVTTFGHAFKQGDVPAGYTVIAKDSSGNPVTLQVDKKATHADGSLRHAILTAKLTTLGASATQAITLFAQADGAAQPAVSLASLLATAFDSQVSLNVGGTVYSASARNLLQGTPKLWLAGPEVSEWIVGGPVKNGGVAHPHLAVYFHVRAYAGSPITKVRVDAVVENGWTLVAGPSDFTYLPTVTIGGTTIYNNGGASLTHFQHTRWHQLGWWNSADSKIYAKLNTTYLQDTKAIPKYETLTPTEAFLNAARQSAAPMTPGDQANMDLAGEADGVGPMPRWDAVYSVSGDKRAFNYMNANHDGAAVYPTHFRDEITKLPVTIDSYPDSDTSDWSGANPRFPRSATANTNNPGSFTSHRPSIGYLAYLVTGDYYYLEEMQFWASYDLAWTASYARTGSAAYQAYASTNGSTGIFYDGTLRGTAWAYRNVAQAASITPDTDPLKSYFANKLNNNLAYHKWQYIDANSPESNSLGMMYQAGRNNPSSSIYGEYRMWYDAFISWAFQYLVDLGVSNAIPMRDYKLKTPIGMMGITKSESCFQWTPQYVSRVGPLSASPVYYATYREVYLATLASLVPEQSAAAAYSCGSPEMAAHMTTALGRTYVTNEMTGGQNNIYYYFSAMQPALAAAADSGLPGGATAWSRSLLSGIHPDYRDQPIWAVIPRTVSQ